MNCLESLRIIELHEITQRKNRMKDLQKRSERIANNPKPRLLTTGTVKLVKNEQK